MKKLAIILGSIFGVLVLAAIVVPLFIDVDKYRPTIISKANEQINGKLELGHLGLSLWGRVKIDIDGLKLSDSAGHQIVKVKDASFNLPFLSLLTGRPELRLQLVNPEIDVIKLTNGKLNAMSLVKETPAQAPQAAPTAPSQVAAAPSGSAGVPAIVLHSRFTLLLEHAKLAYKDEITKDTYNINDLNVKIKDVSPEGKMPFEISANLDMLVQHKIKVSGPVVFEGSVQAHASGGTFDHGDAEASLKLDGLEIVDPTLFNKKKGIALGADLKASIGKDSFNVSTMKFRLGEVTIDGEASGKTANKVTTVNFKAQSNSVDIAKLGDLSPMVKENNLNGLVVIAVHANGPTDQLNYGADIKFNKISLNNEALKQPIEVNGDLSVVTDQLKDLNVKLTAKDFDLDLSGNMQSFTHPHFKFNLVSNNMDLDGLLKSSEKAAEARKEQASQPATGGAQKQAAPVVDYNAMFKPLRENPIAASAAGTFDFNLKRLKSTGIVISNLKGQFALNNLLLALKDFSMGIFDGTIKGNMSFNAKAAKPEVGTNITVAGLETQKMVDSQMPFAHNTIKGAISASLNIGGAGLNMPDIVSVWKGSGNMTIKDAVFSTMDIGKQINDGVVGKLPAPLKSKVSMPDSLTNWKGEYEYVSARFGLLSGVLSITDINGKAYPSKGLDLKGNGTVHLSNYALEMTLDLIDTYNLMNLDNTVKDDRYGHFTLSPHVKGTLFAPQFDWGSTIAKLAQNAIKSQAKSLLQNLVPGSGGGNSGGPGPADAVKAFKGLFGH